MQEFWIAVAGPAVNVVIAAVLFVILAIARRHRSLAAPMLGGPFLGRLMAVNIMLVLFNLLPAFPMDGGRVLRALLALRMSRVRATHIAASVGQFMAILLARQEFLAGNGCWFLSPSLSTSGPRPNRTWSRCDHFSKVLAPGMP